MFHVNPRSARECGGWMRDSMPTLDLEEQKYSLRSALRFGAALSRWERMATVGAPALSGGALTTRRTEPANEEGRGR